MSTYAYNVGYYALREAQDSVSKRLESEVTLLSREGETTQYTITGICLALITASAGVILPIFVWVIKDKSFVIAIFADITHEEATKIIEGTRKIDMKNLHYKRRWIVAAGDGHETFWKKLIAEHHRGFGIGGNIRGLEHERESAVKESSDDLKANLEKVAAEMAEAKDKDEENRAEADEEEAEQIERDKENERIKKEFEEAAKKRKRRHRLSEIDYALRKKFVIRLSCVVFIFYLYGGYSLYFNDYVHNNNSSASSMLFSICKRNVYLHNLNFIVVQALNTKDKVLIGNNVNGTDGKLYAMDIANAMLNIETECKNFEKTASYACYGKYLDQVHLFESSAFCNASDVYSDIASLVGNCTTVYKGPDEYGLSVGISYYINMHIKVSELYLNYNSSDAIQAANVATASDSISRIGFSLTYPLSFALGALMGSFYTCTMNFFDTVRKIVYAASIGFMSVFALVYILVFARFIGMLSEEIWHTRGMLNMIPAEIVENNPGVREQIWRRKGLR
ncbi:MAG: hypothetical protein P4M11_09225 [Candidatus Pacebacteria bacterium]|nr:hypothetical protein [Candidatus Paceibacterota bacterium]